MNALYHSFCCKLSLPRAPSLPLAKFAHGNLFHFRAPNALSRPLSRDSADRGDALQELKRQTTFCFPSMTEELRQITEQTRLRTIYLVRLDRGRFPSCYFSISPMIPVITRSKFQCPSIFPHL